MQAQSIGTLEGRHFDVAVVGAGANGASAAQELSAAGYAVLLVEKADFGCGTSSRSSRMLHCGFRALEAAANKSLWDHVRQLPNRLALLRTAKESLDARADFVTTIPAQIQPITLAMPLTAGGVSGRQMDFAALLLRALGTRGVPLDYKRYSGRSGGDVPFIHWLQQRPDFKGAVTFRDYAFDWPERLCVDAAMHAERNGAVVRNYTAIVGLNRSSGGAWIANLRDEASGATASISARIVLNTAGPWLDQITRLASSDSRPRMALTKGVQIAVRLPNDFRNHGVVASTTKGQFVCIPSQGAHLIGATNSPFDGDPRDACATDGEIDDLIARANSVLPGIGLTRSNVEFAIAGVRPASVGDPGRVLHDYAGDGLPNLISVTGGSIATSRATARRLKKMVADKIGAASSLIAASGVRQFGARQEGGSSADDSVLRAVAGEHAKTISDVAFRRTGAAWKLDFGAAEIDEISTALAAQNGWSASEKNRAVAEFKDELLAAHRRRF